MEDARQMAWREVRDLRQDCPKGSHAMIRHGYCTMYINVYIPAVVYACPGLWCYNANEGLTFSSADILYGSLPTPEVDEVTPPALPGVLGEGARLGEGGRGGLTGGGLMGRF